MNVIELDNLTKFYGKRRGISNLCLKVAQGSIYGFLGPNGAGKTTTIRSLLGFLRPSEGTASICGLDIRKKSLAIRDRTGYLPGDVRFFNHLSGYATLKLLAKLREIDCRKRAEELAEVLDLDLSLKVRTHSRGMRQKLGIIQAMMHDPEVLILDEPTNSLDPLVQQKVYDLLSEYASHGGTVFFSSHIISEVERICDRVAIIRKGKLVADDDVKELQAKSTLMQYVSLILKPGSELTQPVPEGIHVISQKDRSVRLKAVGTSEQLVDYLHTLPLEYVTIESPNLEEVFMQFYRIDGEAVDG